jgi:hypothetical protein
MIRVHVVVVRQAETWYGATLRLDRSRREV